MTEKKLLEDLPASALLQELRNRESKDDNPSARLSADLGDFGDDTLVAVLRNSQKVIYEIDHRTEVFQLPQGPDLDDADSVVALFRAGSVSDNGDGTATLRTANFGQQSNLCPGERFREQPTGAFCSGFLVAPDIIATAGHCVNADTVGDVRFVFGFRMRDAETAQTAISNADIYRGVALVGHQLVGNGADWALVRLDRPVANHRIARLRRAGRIGDTQAVHVIGHPAGLPTKFAGGASVRDNAPDAYFIANLDAFGGNSGSPVFNSETHEVEGILVRGETDFVRQGTCQVSLVCPTTGCRGEDCTRATLFASLVPEPPTS
jgi:hypothetical protein